MLKWITALFGGWVTSSSYSTENEKCARAVSELCSFCFHTSPNKAEFIRAKYQMLAFVHRLPCRDDDSVTAKDLSKVGAPCTVCCGAWRDSRFT